MKNHHDSMSTESRGFLDVSADQRRREGVSSVTKRHSEGPSTPGRPIFRFSTSGNFSSRKSFPSKWDDAEKWLNGSSSCHDSPAHHHTHGSKPLEGTKVFKQFEGCRPQVEVFAEKTRVTEEKVTKSVSSTKGSIAVENLGISDRAFNGISASANVLLKGRKPLALLPHFLSTNVLQKKKKKCTPSIAIQNALYCFHLFVVV